ncbi:hypothetical protein M3221_03465 [Domibacillus indicus]|uniref:hypothetical protein n=1 Tax=Domibacillus indicus TaxID=1437523 RepID=UPI00203C3DCF|nr:hypothetical protein [Domibacillus indicus]MCM3787473.1 hypothetical protein [Domibacillus indicus]
MSFNHIKDTLETICFFKSVNITHTFSKNDEPLLHVQFAEEVQKIQITWPQTNKKELYNDVDKAAEVIQEFVG